MRSLHRDALTPDERGVVYVVLDDEANAGAASERVHAALDAAGKDWGDDLHLGPRPARRDSQ